MMPTASKTPSLSALGLVLRSYPSITLSSLWSQKPNLPATTLDKPTCMALVRMQPLPTSQPALLPSRLALAFPIPYAATGYNKKLMNAVET